MREYFLLVEKLFRQGKIRLVFATSTLAYGINMPARTIVFLGKNKYLTPMIFQQCGMLSTFDYGIYPLLPQ